MAESTNEQGATVSEREHACCPVIELRQYTLHPGKRDVLIDLFDREFIESQEALGMQIIGQFRDLDDPNRFVWLRGFLDMDSRAESLTNFYDGPVWRAHRDGANETIIDSDNVLLLRPARPGSEFHLRNDRPPTGNKQESKALITVTICYFDEPATGDFVEFFASAIKPRLENAGASVLAYFVTERSTNTFPRLPVREGEDVFVWVSRFKDQAAFADHEAALSRLERWRNDLSKELARQLKGKPEVLKLSPTSRSRLRSL